MKKKKRKIKLKEIKQKLEKCSIEKNKKIGFEMVRDKRVFVIDPKEKAKRKEKKHKRRLDYD